jgi:hypothetical protein
MRGVAEEFYSSIKEVHAMYKECHGVFGICFDFMHNLPFLHILVQEMLTTESLFCIHNLKTTKSWCFCIIEE